MLYKCLKSTLSSGMLMYASCIHVLGNDIIMNQHLKIGPARAQVVIVRVNLMAGVIRIVRIGL